MVKNQTFTSSDVARLCALGPGEIAQWTARGILSITPPEGKGHPRIFTFWNLCEAHIAKSLSATLGMPAAHLEVVMQGIRDRIQEMGAPSTFPMESFYFGDWSFWIIKSGDGHRVMMRMGALPDDALFPVVGLVSLSAIAQGLIDKIEGSEASMNWYRRAVDARRANRAGRDAYVIPMAANAFSRDEITMK